MSARAYGCIFCLTDRKQAAWRACSGVYAATAVQEELPPGGVLFEIFRRRAREGFVSIDI